VTLTSGHLCRAAFRGGEQPAKDFIRRRSRAGDHVGSRSDVRRAAYVCDRLTKVEQPGNCLGVAGEEAVAVQPEQAGPPDSHRPFRLATTCRNRQLRSGSPAGTGSSERIRSMIPATSILNVKDCSPAFWPADLGGAVPATSHSTSGLYVAVNPVRFVTSTALFDGHDAPPRRPTPWKPSGTPRGREPTCSPC
jgi:hypothetical protein